MSNTLRIKLTSFALLMALTASVVSFNAANGPAAQATINAAYRQALADRAGALTAWANLTTAPLAQAGAIQTAQNDPAIAAVASNTA